MRLCCCRIPRDGAPSICRKRHAGRYPIKSRCAGSKSSQQFILGAEAHWNFLPRPARADRLISSTLHPPHKSRPLLPYFVHLFPPSLQNICYVCDFRLLESLHCACGSASARLRLQGPRLPRQLFRLSPESASATSTLRLYFRLAFLLLPSS